MFILIQASWLYANAKKNSEKKIKSAIRQRNGGASERERRRRTETAKGNE